MKLQAPNLSREHLLSWLHQHRLALKTAINHMLSNPVSTLLTILAIAIALALPSTIFLTVNAISSNLGDHDGRQLTAFMKLHIDGKQLHTLATELEKNPKIDHVDVITRAESLENFRQSSGMEDIIELLPDNPLPAVLVIHPDGKLDRVETLQRLKQQVESMTEVASVALNQEWMSTLFATLHAIERFALMTALLFAFLVALVIYNGLRIEVLRHRNEIEVIKLVGGSDHYIQRPFHYHAIMLGGLGALFAALLVAIAFMGLRPHLSELSRLYGTPLSLELGINFIFTLFLLGVILSLLSARISLNSLLKGIQP